MPRNGPEIQFLGWDRPGLLSACDRIAAQAVGQEMDLSRLAVVVPGGRVGRNLRALLLDRAARERRAYSPPRVMTAGAIPDLVLGIEGRFANAVARRLAWAEALRGMPEEELGGLVPHPPHHSAAGDLRGWLALGDLLQRCHSELAAGLLTFAEVPRRCGGGEFLEEERWRAAAAVQERYRQVLAERGLRDVDLARLEALGQTANSKWQMANQDLFSEHFPVAMGPMPFQEIVLVGVSELSAVARESLRLAAERVMCLVLAPEELRESFDEFGCPREEVWATRKVAVREEQVAFATRPGDQAEQALVAIAKLGGGLAADQISIGIADEEVVPFLERRAEAAGAAVRYAGGRPVEQTGPWRLLRGIAEYLERGDLKSLRGLVRHPDVEWQLRVRLSGESSEPPAEWWLAAMDAYASESLHGRLDGSWHTADSGLAELLCAVHGEVEWMLAPLRAGEEGPRPADAWAGAMLEVLARVYEGRLAGAHERDERLMLGGCRALREAIDELRELEGAQWPRMSAAEALHLVMERAAAEAVPEEEEPGAIEMLGWLELPLDPAEAVVVVGMNDGKIPASFCSDPFLTESMRERLGIASSRRRLARDAYVLTALMHSRQHTSFIAGRRTARGDPLWPSRLLVSGEAEALPRRIRRFLGKEAEAEARLAKRIRPGTASRFGFMPLAQMPVIDSMRVTAFRTYIASPYLFYLEHVLRLGESGEPGAELDAAAFGNLIHKALEEFGRSDVKLSADAEKVAACLLDHLDTLAGRRFGRSPGAAVALQLEIARRRLRAVAEWQAQRTREGWLIAANPEWQPTDGRAELKVDGAPMRLRGRIDRIERHEGTGQLAILDFKTGDNAKEPDKAHRNSRGWIDLQLPLYRHLAAELGACDSTMLGYVVIPGDVREVKLLSATWTPEQLAEADDRAHQIVRAVREGRFGEVGEGAREGTVFASLCGIGLIGAGEEEP